MNDWLLNVQSKNAFREISEGYKIGVKHGEENEQIKRNIKRTKRKQN